MINQSGGSVGIGYNVTYTPVSLLDVNGGINSISHTASVILASNISASVVTSSLVKANIFQLPYSSSARALTLYTDTGSAYFQISASVKLLYIYTGTTWSSCSLA